MRGLAVACLVVIAIAGLTGFAAPQEKEAGMKGSGVSQSPEWQKIQSLVGEWESFIELDGRKVPTRVEVRMTGDGSAVMHVIDRDTPHEMVTMFHPDGKRLIATHYCSAHNQPRMALVASKDANTVAFKFFDGTNIAPGEGYMNGLVVTFIDADRHDETWTFLSKGKEESTTFSYRRKKK
ncbi:MAG: hypothetical protein EHM13_10885 [Acidobacteria bacterium]|nr:MAG: hypothetical protein EHM13_10885 [Acidobacteriota bacterium]